MTRNGPAEPTVRATSSCWVPPPVGNWSRAVSRKRRVRAAVGSSSEKQSSTAGGTSSPLTVGQEPVAALVVPASTWARSGKVRDGSPLASFWPGES